MWNNDQYQNTNEIEEQLPKQGRFQGYFAHGRSIDALVGSSRCPWSSGTSATGDNQNANIGPGVTAQQYGPQPESERVEPASIAPALQAKLWATASEVLPISSVWQLVQHRRQRQPPKRKRSSWAKTARLPFRRRQNSSLQQNILKNHQRQEHQAFEFNCADVEVPS